MSLASLRWSGNQVSWRSTIGCSLQGVYNERQPGRKEEFAPSCLPGIGIDSAWCSSVATPFGVYRSCVEKLTVKPLVALVVSHKPLAQRVKFVAKKPWRASAAVYSSNTYQATTSVDKVCCRYSIDICQLQVGRRS